jgi:hypothetical protein
VYSFNSLLTEILVIIHATPHHYNMGLERNFA